MQTIAPKFWLDLEPGRLDYPLGQRPPTRRLCLEPLHFGPIGQSCIRFSVEQCAAPSGWPWLHAAAPVDPDWPLWLRLAGSTLEIVPTDMAPALLGAALANGDLRGTCADRAAHLLFWQYLVERDPAMLYLGQWAPVAQEMYARMYSEGRLTAAVQAQRLAPGTASQIERAFRGIHGLAVRMLTYRLETEPEFMAAAQALLERDLGGGEGVTGLNAFFRHQLMDAVPSSVTEPPSAQGVLFPVQPAPSEPSEPSEPPEPEAPAPEAPVTP